MFSVKYAFCIAILILAPAAESNLVSKKKHHHKHDKDAGKASQDPAKKEDGQKEEQILNKMKTLEGELAKKEEAVKGVVTKGRIEVNGPLPADFSARFAQGVSKATGAEPSEIKVVETNPVSGGGDVV